MEEVPARLTRQRLTDAADLRRANAALSAEAERRRRDAALRALDEVDRWRIAEERWADSVGQAPDHLELRPPPPLPEDLAALWGEGQRSPRASSGDSTQSAT
jgi:hypothetical protein